jgi:hypothetical protein
MLVILLRRQVVFQSNGFVADRAGDATLGLLNFFHRQFDLTTAIRATEFHIYIPLQMLLKKSVRPPKVKPFCQIS